MTSQAIPRAARRARDTSVANPGIGSPRVIPLLFFTVLVIGVFFLMIYLRIALDQSAFELDTLEDQIAVEESAQLDLRLELAQLQDPQRIAQQAAQIGLVFPEERVALVLAPVAPLDASPQQGEPASALSTGDGS
ncbi:MAG: hypothetical protein M3132_14285 [Actinomycetia bacterium]|nr:hypothetical protein [Actinomycetes bacterium]